MATYTWKVPLLDYPAVAELLWEAHLASRRRDKQRLGTLTERLRLLGCPKAADLANDTIEVVPAGARLTITAEPLPGLPR